MNPFQVVKDFEAALCEYTGAPYVVTITSCTMALLLAVAWHLRDIRKKYEITVRPGDLINGERYSGPEYKTMAFVGPGSGPLLIEIPKRTYIGVGMSIVHAGGRPIFREEKWLGAYELKPLKIWDCARIFTGGMYSHQESTLRKGMMQCVSFHWNKTLGIQQGGAILHDNPEADRWLRKARFDGRSEGVPPVQDIFDVLGWHCYMSPETAAAGLVRLASLPRENLPLPWDDYPDLSTLALFK